MNRRKQRRIIGLKRAAVTLLAFVMLLSICSPSLTALATQLDTPDTGLDSPNLLQTVGENSDDTGTYGSGENFVDSGNDGSGENSVDSGNDGSGENSGDSGTDGSGENSVDSGSDGSGENSGDFGNDGSGENAVDSGSDGSGENSVDSGSDGSGENSGDFGNDGSGENAVDSGSDGSGENSDDSGNDGSGENSESGTESDSAGTEGTEETGAARLNAYLNQLAKLEEEATYLEADEEVLDNFYFDGLLAVWDAAQEDWGNDLLTDEQMDEINLKASAIVTYLETEYHYFRGDLVTYGAEAMTGDLTPVAGNGITFRLFDYEWDINNFIATRGDLENYFCFRGSGMAAAHPNNGIPESYNTTYDADGYISNHATVENILGDYDSPVLQLAKDALGNSRTDPGVSADNRNLGFLFDYGISGYVTAYSPSNTILQYDSSTNRYYYNSKNNAVDYDAVANVFRLRNYVENTQSTSSYDGYHDFLPFNYTAGTSVGTNASTNIPYHVSTADANYWFGMTMEVDFYMPKNGQINGQDMKFHFSGDDDVWVFIDDVLVLDLGGTHGTVDGNINFATGEVLQYLSWNKANADDDAKKNGSATSFPTTLKTRFKEAGTNPNGGWNTSETTFGDYTKHTLKFFYMERGAAVANCSLEFNLPTLPDNTLQLGKELTVSNPAEEDSPVKEYLDSNLSYQFRIWECDENGNKIGTTPLFANKNFKIKQDGVADKTGTVSADGIISLKADQMAVFTNMLASYSNLKHYKVEEILSNDLKGQYGNIEFKINGENGSSFVPEDTEGMDGYTSFYSHVITIDEVNKNTSATVLYTNKVDINKLSMLKVTKTIAAGSVSTQEKFPITVKLDGIPVEAGTQYIINDDPNCIGTVEAGGIIRLAGGETATLVKGIISGTQFTVTETLSSDQATIWNASYSGTVTDSNGTKDLTGTENISGTFPLNSTVHVTVTNRSYDLSCEIPVTKTYIGNTNATKNFTFALKDSGGNIIDGAQTTITVTDDKLTTGSITLGYKSDVEIGTYRYKLCEVVEENDRKTNYDPSIYDVEVTVSEENGKKTAVVTSITLDGKDYEAAAFVNHRTTQVAVSKTVSGNMGDQSKAFTFTATLPGVGYSFNGVTYSIDNGEAQDVTAVANVFTFTLKHGQSITFSGLPIGANFTVTETSYSESGYETTVDGASESSKTITLAETNPTIEFVNTNDVTIDTGVLLDTLPYILILGVVAVGAVLLIKKRRNRDDD